MRIPPQLIENIQFDILPTKSKLVCSTNGNKLIFAEKRRRIVHYKKLTK